MNCLAYARVSTTEQADKDLSIPAQLDAIKVYAEDNKFAIVDEFVDAGESAKSADRPQLQEMLSRCRRDKSIEFVLIHKLDRLARNLNDHVAIKALLGKNNIQLISVTER